MAAEINFSLSAKAAPGGKTALTVLPLPGFHINYKAPNSVESIKPRQVFHASKASETQLAYELSSGDYLLAVFVCDAANTYCVKQETGVRIEDGAKLTLTAAQPPEEAQTASGNAVEYEKGFIMNDLAFALAKAKTEKKNVLLDFSAIWCPACLKLEKDVFETPEFESKSKALVKLRVDLDWQGSRLLRERYHIRDVPTVVILDPVGEELGRIHGYRPKSQYLAELSVLSKSGLTPLAELKARAIVGDKKAADRAGLLAYDSLDFEAALLLWKDTEVYRERKLAAEINLLSDDDASHAAGEGAAGDRRNRLIAALENIVKNYPDSPDRLGWLQLLIETYEKSGEKAKAKSHATELLAFSKKLLAEPVAIEKAVSIDSSRDDAEYTVGEVWAFRARAEKFLGETAGEQAAWKSAIDETKRGIHDPGDKGRKLLLVRILGEAGHDAEIDAVLEDLQMRYPTEYTFYYKRASRFFKAGKLSEAEKLALAAVSHAYGTNRIDSSIVLAKTQKALGKTAEAKATAGAAIKQIDPGATFLPDKSTQHRLEELKAI